MPEIKPGSILLERYLVEKLLGVGGSSAVYLVFDQILNRQVAIKFLHQWSTHSGSSIPLLRFEREAQSLSQLLHPNIVRVFRFGVLENNEAFLVMEYTQGETLRAFLDRKGALPCDEAIAICLQVCAGLEYAHSAQMVHRDLKPENIMVVETAYDTTVKILDFGLCKFVTDKDQLAEIAELAADTESTIGFTLTETGLLIGTAAYMSPEQGMGEVVDYRSDIYSFGCVLFELITGAPPFPGEAPGAILLKHMSEPTPKILEIAPDSGYPQLLQDIILKCTAKNKKNRYQSFSELSKDLISLDQLNCKAVFKTRTKRSQGLSKGKILAGISVLASILLLFAGFLFNTGQGKLLLAWQMQESQNPRDACKSILQIHSDFLGKHDLANARKLLESSTSSNIFHNWPSVERADLLLGFIKSNKQAKLEDDAFSTTVLFLDQTLDSIRHELLRAEPPQQEVDDLAGISKELYFSNFSKKQWAAISKVIDSKGNAFSPRARSLYMLWPSVLRCKAQVLGGLAQTQDSKIELAKHYLYAADIARSSNRIDLMFSMANQELELTRKSDLPYAEHFLHSMLCHYYLDTNQMDKARAELAALEVAAKNLVLSDAETDNRNKLRKKIGIGKIEVIPEDDGDNDRNHPLILRMIGDKSHE